MVAQSLLTLLYNALLGLAEGVVRSIGWRYQQICSLLQTVITVPFSFLVMGSTSHCTMLHRSSDDGTSYS
ncbi:Glutamyl-tRNA(Gln) amidotransferase subunit C [Bienertia sinuspersici]